MNTMDQTICGADCGDCNSRTVCRGCAATGGKPFGGTCIAAEYIKLGGPEHYAQFKKKLLAEVNVLLRTDGIPEADALHELPGAYVNLAYPIPSGGTVKLLDETKVYLGCQIALDDTGLCCGVVADTNFILVCNYSENGLEPELMEFHKR